MEHMDSQLFLFYISSTVYVETSPPPEITITGDGQFNTIDPNPPTAPDGNVNGQAGGGATSVTAFYSIVVFGVLVVLML